jgi:hypothetical protein
MSKKPPANAVSPAAADAFSMRMKHWQAELNLHDWRIERHPKPASRNALAEVTRMSLVDRLAVYKLGQDFGETKPVSEQSLDEIACHESLHVLLCELIEFCRDKDSKPEDIDAAEHRVIHTLVRLLVPEN